MSRQIIIIIIINKMKTVSCDTQISRSLVIKGGKYLYIRRTLEFGFHTFQDIFLLLLYKDIMGWDFVGLARRFVNPIKSQDD